MRRLWLPVLAFALAIVPSIVGAQESGRPTKRVLIISTGTRLSPGFALLSRGLDDVLGKIPSVSVDTYAENLDVVRFPMDRFQRVFAEYLTEKYAGQRPDAVILAYVGNLAATVKVLQQIFPKTPIVVAGYTEEPIAAGQFGGLVSGVAQHVDPGASIGLILRLQPDTRRIVVVGGTAGVDRDVLDRVREAAKPFAGRVAFDFWDKLSLAELRQAVASLPAQTAVLFSRSFRDAAGQPVISGQIGQSIAELANAPVYVMTDTSLGTGAVGGYLASAEGLGRRAGELTRLLLTGTALQSLPLEVRSDTTPMFDARALKRWGIRESELPANSVVRFRQESFWEQYHWYVLIALIVFLVQTAIIVDFLLERRRRSRMQAELGETRQLVELAATAGELGLWARDLKSGAVWASPTLRSMFGLNSNDSLQTEDLMTYIHPEDRPAVRAQMQHAQERALPLESEFRILLPDGSLRWVLTKGRTVDDARHRMGVVLDITERKRAEEAVRESEERFRLVADAAPMMVWMTGTDKLCTFVNKSWVAFTGREMAQDLGDGWAENVHAEDRQRILEIYNRAFDGRQRFMMAYRLRRFDAEYRWVLDTGAPRFKADGDFLGYIGSCVDITEIHRAEERFRLAVEASANAIIMTNQQDEIVMINTAAETMLGYSSDELFGQPFELLVSERFRSSHEPHRAEFLAAPQSGSMRAARELFALNKDGREIPVQIALSSIETDDGLFLLTSIIDITERKRGAEALEKERAFLRLIIDTVPDFIFAKDEEGRFTLANKAVADAYGTTVQKLIGKTDADFNPNRVEVEFYRRIDQEVLSTQRERFIPEERLTDIHGNVRWLQTVKRLILEHNGAGRQVLGASTDITRRKLAEMQLQEQRAELAHVARISTMGELAASLAHELNQPLTAILSNAQAALRFLDGEAVDYNEVREILQDIVKDNSRAADVIRRMRALVKKEELEFAALDPSGLIRDVVALVHSDTILRGAAISVESRSELPPMRGDRVQLQQVMLNLLLNAFDAMKEAPANGRRAIIRAEVYGRMIKLSVRDSGPGLPPEKLDKLFQPFYTTKRDGLGMGLSICRSIVEAHQGHLWAENNNGGRGATFSFTVPVEDRAGQQPPGSDNR
ncbi:MAG TPA: PAS domain S-box protein [Candidatus Binatia bacterium]|jgi:PAS domain S-box-containing protein